jgi:hypothetical protein
MYIKIPTVRTQTESLRPFHLFDFIIWSQSPQQRVQYVDQLVANADY